MNYSKLFLLRQNKNLSRYYRNTPFLYQSFEFLNSFKLIQIMECKDLQNILPFRSTLEGIKITDQKPYVLW